MPSVFRRALTPKYKNILEVTMKRIITLALMCLMVVAFTGLTACGTPTNSNVNSTGGYSIVNQPEVTAENFEDKVPTNDFTAILPEEEERERKIAEENLEAAKLEYENGKKVLEVAKQEYELAKQEMELIEQRYENGEISQEELSAAMQEFFQGPHNEYFAAQRAFFDGPHREYFDAQAEYSGR